MSGERRLLPVQNLIPIRIPLNYSSLFVNSELECFVEQVARTVLIRNGPKRRTLRVSYFTST
jgi:hypothetical protein